MRKESLQSQARSVQSAVRNADPQSVTLEAVDDRKDRSFLRKSLTGILGGLGYGPDGGERGSLTTRTIGDRRYGFFDAAGDSGGANVMKGTAGRVLGKGIRMLGAFEVASLAVDAGTYALGEGYEAMVETTERLQRRVGADHSMSGGYYNRAASTERQRAVQSLNRNQLNPRTQIQGNEAYYAHH